MLQGHPVSRRLLLPHSLQLSPICPDLSYTLLPLRTKQKKTLRARGCLLSGVVISFPHCLLEKPGLKPRLLRQLWVVCHGIAEGRSECLLALGVCSLPREPQVLTSCVVSLVFHCPWPCLVGQRVLLQGGRKCWQAPARAVGKGRMQLTQDLEAGGAAWQFLQLSHSLYGCLGQEWE